ncbi:MAG: YIP1 family protein [Xanthomonadaceae bacterium]|nr:YIP1 family protein [Xanthomonadaceae bacterium]MDE1884442.1 YIP1 family protein [Xanthomonadaceae bacterium]MDE1960696.1 YIP1 family protein [Xanthomonadaceae bacterium]MDE2083763.1 YIP1 family protein [Xanthomonadaceae bacterium]MDE2257788.1 YIP1 family protein [Xanthomonadaceae bacterium]
MDFNKLIARVKNILLTPKTEWPAIAGETETVQSLYLNYILVLAAIPAVFGFIKTSIIGSGAFGITVRASIGAGITHMIIQYVLTLVMLFVMALIIDALAGTFGAQKNQVQALKTSAYTYTASAIASIGLILGFGLGMLIGLAGLIYGIYLLYLGLPNTMKCPPEKAGGYTAVSIICAIVLWWIIGLVTVGIVGTSMLGAGGFHIGSNSGFSLDGSGSSVTVDSSSALGKLAAIGQKMGEAGQKMEAAQKSGDANAQAQAAGQMLGTVLGGGSQVEALAPDAIKAFVPDTLAGLKRTSVSAERNGAMGMQVSAANATYSDGQHSLHLEIADSGSAKGIMALAGAVGVEADNETDHGYDKTYKQDGRLVHEQWNTQSKYGEFSIVLGDRFSVKVSGNADSIDQLKAAVGSINLAGLEALKNQGVKSQ